MSASELSSIDQFDKEYPSGLPARLQWLESRLQTGRGRMLRLMGLSNAEAASAGKRSWSEIAREYEFQAERAEHLLTHYLSYFDYDIERARGFAKRFLTKFEAGNCRLTDYVPALASARTPAQREQALLAAIEQEGPSLLPALACFLASPKRNGRW